MLALVVSSVLLMCLGAATTVAGSPIVNGFAPGNSFDFPYMVSLQLRNGTAAPGPDDPDGSKAKQATLTVTGLNHFCGGIYLCDGVIATAAHCVCHLRDQMHDVYAVVGAVKLCDEHPKAQRTYRAQRIDCKPFDPYTYENDIALVHIDVAGNEPVPSDQLVQLPTIDAEDDETAAAMATAVDTNALPGLAPPAVEEVALDAKLYDRCYLMGYGSTELHGSPTLKLMIGKNTRIPLAECSAKLGKFMAPEPGMKMFCAEGVGSDGRPVDTCQGDSGGPFVCKRRGTGGGKYEVVGLTSYGAGCGAPNTPGVYTSMRGHAEWIRGVLEEVAADRSSRWGEIKK